MTATPPAKAQRSPYPVRHLLWQLPLIAVTLCLARWWILRGQPERLVVFPGDSLIGLQNGQIFFADTTMPAPGQAYVTIRAMPVTGGPVRRIVREPGLSLVPVALTDTDLFYLVETSRSTPTLAPDPARPFFQARILHNAFSLRCVPLAGGPSQLVRAAPSPFPTYIQGYSNNFEADYKDEPVYTAVRDGQLYWIDARPNFALHKRVGKYEYRSETPRSTLMVAPLAGGPARHVATGLFSNTRLFPGEVGVYWVQSHGPYRNDLYSFRAIDPAPRVLHNYDLSPTTPTMLQGRFYWIAHTLQPTAFPGFNGTGFSALYPAATGIASANPDGTDLRTLMTFARDSSGVREAADLTSSRGKLYVRLIRESVPSSGSRTGDDPVPQDDLYSYLPGRDAGFRKICRLPLNMDHTNASLYVGPSVGAMPNAIPMSTGPLPGPILGEGYFYYVVAEPGKEKPSPSPEASWKLVLYRSRLPN